MMREEGKKMFDGQKRLGKALQDFRRCESGATAIEYALIVALIFLAVLAAVQSLGSSTSGMYTNISDSMENN